ncbi:MAG: hypothetical protein H0V66_03130 [Bdellovibrionales bacterium]|nr:hypothetical protein [Bdellovibrionales bacterium]
MKIVFLFLLILLPLKLLANGQVVEIYDTQEIIADIYDSNKMKTGDKIIIVSRRANRAIAFGSVKKIDMEVSPHVALIAIEEIIDNNMIMVKDLVYPVDYELMKAQNIPGFASLSLQGDHDIPAKFKELAYFGVFTSEGHTLDAQEFLISPFQLQYGLTDDFGVKMVNALWLDGYANAGVKYRAMRNKYAKISLNTLGAYKIQSNDYIWQTGGVITLPQNAKFQNHFMVNIILDPQFEDAHATKGLGKVFQNSDIRSITEYITNDWNRILYGPTYNVELQKLGGTASYMWIWTNFHVSLGIATQDFTNLSFGSNGYYYVYDFFWRF